jgi:maleylacetate reductase
MNSFVFESLPGRVIFGVGALARLPREIEQLGARRALVLSTPPQRALAESVVALLGERGAGIFPEAVMHVPVEVAQRAVTRLGASAPIAWLRPVAVRRSALARRLPCIRACRLSQSPPPTPAPR